MATHRHAEALNDEQALAGFRQGCQDCFALLFRRYWRSVLHIAMKILRDRSEAEDVLQEVFLDIYLRPERFDESKGLLKSWLFQQCYYRALLRRRYLSSRAVESLEPHETVARMDQPGMPLAQDPYLACLIGHGLSAISPAQRRTVELVHFEGYTLQEISTLCGQTLAATRNYYYRGLKALRSFLARTPAKRAQTKLAMSASDATHV